LIRFRDGEAKAFAGCKCNGGELMIFENSPTSAPSGCSSLTLLEHMFSMPRFHKSLLALAMLLLGTGGAGQLANFFSKQPPPAATSNAMVAASNDSTAVAPPVSTTDQPPEQPKPLFTRVSPLMTRVGFTFIAGFIIGWAFRAFLKITAMLTSLGMAILVGLSYFHVLNIDFTSVEKKYQTDMAWVSDQADRAGKALLAHIPGSSSSFVGMFIGFKRK
jgi:uncharacterized membrane protein (Fun14 family)